MPASVFIEIIPNQMEAIPGGQADARIRVTNRGDNAEHYALAVQGPESQWVRLEPEQIGLFPGDQAEVRLHLRPPGDRVSITYRVNVVAANQVDPSDQAAAVLALRVRKAGSFFTETQPEGAQAPREPDVSSTWEVAQPAKAMPPAIGSGEPEEPPEAQVVSPAGDITFTASRNPMTVVPGIASSYLLGLSNRSGASLQLTLAFKGLPAGWLSLEQERVFLAPGQTCNVAFAVSVPSQAPLGDYPLVISTEGNEERGLLQLNLLVELVKPLEVLLKLEPVQAEGETSATYEVQMRQSGIMPIKIFFSASDAGGELNYLFSPPSIILGGIDLFTSRLKVSIKNIQQNMYPRVYPFTVTASPVGGSIMPVNVQGQFLQKQSLQAKLSLLPQEQREPVKATFLLRISNPSQNSDNYFFSVNEQDGSCNFEFQPASLAVPAGGQANTVLSVIPRMFLATGEQVHTFTITAQSRNNRSASIQTQGRFIQMATRLPGLKLIPPIRSSHQSANYTIQVHNPGIAPLEMELHLESESQMLRFKLAPQQFIVSPGKKAKARLVVNSLQSLLPGESRRVCTFKVIGNSTMLPNPISAEGMLMMLGRRKRSRSTILPYLIIDLLILCGILAIAIFIFWYWTQYPH